MAAIRMPPGASVGRDEATDVGHDTQTQAATSAASPAVRKRWADLLRRVYEVDPLVCPKCAGQMRVVGFVTEPPTCCP